MTQERNMVLGHNKTFLLVAQEDISSCEPRKMSSCDTSERSFLCYKRLFLLVSQDTFLLVAQEAITIRSRHHARVPFNVLVLAWDGHQGLYNLI